MNGCQLWDARDLSVGTRRGQGKGPRRRGAVAPWRCAARTRHVVQGKFSGGGWKWNVTLERL